MRGRLCIRLPTCAMLSACLSDNVVTVIVRQLELGCFSVQASLLGIVQQLAPVLILLQRSRISDHPARILTTSQRYIHASNITHKSHTVLRVLRNAATHTADDHNIILSPLVAIYGAHLHMLQAVQVLPLSIRHGNIVRTTGHCINQ